MSTVQGARSITSPPDEPTRVEFNPYSDDFFDSPYETYGRLRDEAPVYYNESYNFYALSRYEDVAPAYKDFETYSSAKGFNLDMIETARQGEEVRNFGDRQTAAQSLRDGYGRAAAGGIERFGESGAR